MTEPNRQSGENEERIIEIEIERLRPFKEHPFQVKDDKEMFLLQESIEKYGILNPLIVRPVPDAQAIPSLSQAQRIWQLSKEKQLSLEKMEEIMCEVKKGEITRVAFTNEQLHKYFPNSYTPAMMKREILALLKLWKKESWES